MSQPHSERWRQVEERTEQDTERSIVEADAFISELGAEDRPGQEVALTGRGRAPRFTGRG